jgi:hypothetical protein
MSLIKSRFGRLAAALGIALIAEIALLAGATLISSKLPQLWDERLWAVTQEPAYHLVDWHSNVHHPGFEEQGAYFLLIPLIQWMVWGGVFYLFLSRKKSSSSV